jgi:hypothetical protein
MANFPMPLNDPIANPRRRGLKPEDRDQNEGKLSDVWIPYMQSQNSISSTAIRQTTAPVSLSAQAASIGTTAIPTSSLASGLYRVTYYTRITTAAGTSSSLITTFTWTDGGISCSLSSAALTGNTTSTVGTGSALINIDASSPISYSTTYASVGAPVMAYSLYITLEEMNG